MRVLKNKNGSVTVEAAIILPIILSLILSLVFIIKIVHTHVTVQHAINDAANEIATYSYLYSTSGLQKIHDNGKDALNEKGQQAEKDLELVSSSWDAFLEMGRELGEAASATNTTDVGELKEKLKNIKKSGDNSIQTTKEVKELVSRIGKNPKQEMVSIGSLLGECMLEDAKSYIIQPISGYFIKKNLENSEQDADTRLKKMSVVNGFDGLDLSDSTIFKDKKTVDIVVKYRMKLPLPINILPDIYIVQRSTVRAWLDGDGSKWAAKYEQLKDDVSDESETPENVVNPEESGSEDNSDENSEKKEIEKTVWDLPPKERGKVLQTEQGRNLPDKFPTIDKVQNNKLYTINSIDTTDPTYQKPKNIKFKIDRFINELNEFTEGNYKETKVTASDYVSKTVVIIVPKDSKTPVNSKVFEECKEYAESLKIQLVVIEHSQKKTEG